MPRVFLRVCVCVFTSCDETDNIKPEDKYGSSLFLYARVVEEKLFGAASVSRCSLKGVWVYFVGLAVHLILNYFLTLSNTLILVVWTFIEGIEGLFEFPRGKQLINLMQTIPRYFL